MLVILVLVVMLQMVGDDSGDGGYAPMTSSVPGSRSWLVVGITTRYCYITNDNGEDVKTSTVLPNTLTFISYSNQLLQE